MYIVVLRIRWTNFEINNLLTFFGIGMIINGFFMIHQFFNESISLARASGFMDNPNKAAIAYNLLILYFYHLLFRKDFEFKKKILVALAIAFTSIVIFTTGSRTGLILFGLGIIYNFLKTGLAFKLLVTSSLLVILIISHQNIHQWINQNYKNYNLLVRLANNNPYEDERIIIWQGAINAIKSSGGTGVGIAQFRYEFGKYFKGVSIRHERRGKDGLGLHNDYMNILVSGGFVAFFLYVIFLMTIFFKKVKFCFNTYRFENYQLEALCFIIISGMVSSSFITPTFWFFLSVVSINIYPKS